MVDARFYTNCGPFDLGTIAGLTGAELLLNGEKAAASTAALAQLVYDVAPLDRASARDISFFDNSKYIDLFKESGAGACFVRQKYAAMAPAGMALFISADPYRCYALIAQKFYPVAPLQEASISPQAYIDQTAKIAANCSIAPGAFIGANVVIGTGSMVGPNAVIESGVSIGEHTSIGAGSTLSHCIVGSRVIIHRNVNIGQDGFGFAMGRDGHVKVPQLGRVVIEDDVEIGSGSCIDRGTGPDTFIGAGSKIDNLVQIAHNVHIGKNAVIVAQVGIAGSSRIGDGAVIAGQAGIAGHLRIGAGVKLAAKSGVMCDIPAGESWGGSPAVPVKDWHRQTLTLTRMARKRREDNE